VRALDDQYVKEVGKKVVNCIKGAALMTGSESEYEILQGYRAMKYNRCLNDVFAKNIGRLGIKIDDLPEYGGGSTDMGNVSQVVPSIHPFFKIKDGVVPHTKEFAEAADTEEAFKATMIAAKALAMTGIDLLTSPETFNQVREQFEK
jgi:metal-dependent amidase/aminoacylase/carboxypeptidase family protein